LTTKLPTEARPVAGWPYRRTLGRVRAVEDRESARSDVESDAELIEQSLRGRFDAFVEVVGRHEVAVHAFLARRGGRQAADDLLSEVWVRAFGARAGCDPRYESARPWLYGIARNVLRIHWRAARGSGALVPAGEVDPSDDVVDRLDLTAAAPAGHLEEE
jgi:RNA polymerase sigma-70 factor (ECF subfamily)